MNKSCSRCGKPEYCDGTGFQYWDFGYGVITSNPHCRECFMEIVEALHSLMDKLVLRVCAE